MKRKLRWSDKMNNKLKCRKQGLNKLICKRTNKEITFTDCNNCKYKEYKEINKLKSTTPLKVNKPIKKVSKKRIIVSEETYNIVYSESKGRCALCNNIDNLQLHHILYRSERKDLIDEPSNCVMLCHQDFSKNKCHRVVHNNKKKYQSMLLDIKTTLTII